MRLSQTLSISTIALVVLSNSFTGSCAFSTVKSTKTSSFSIFHRFPKNNNGINENTIKNKNGRVNGNENVKLSSSSSFALKMKLSDPSEEKKETTWDRITGPKLFKVCSY